MDNLMITAVFSITYMCPGADALHQTRIIHDTTEAKVRAMDGFVRIVSMQDEPIITHAMVTGNGLWSCD